jgi:ribose/xylose/arabinose/galactoside ABC-type transport system permease subunit
MRLVILWTALSLASPYFLTPINILNVFLQASIIGVVAFGSTVALITEEIDLSIGALEGFTSVVAAIVVVKLELPWPVGVIAAITCGMPQGIGAFR